MKLATVAQPHVSGGRQASVDGAAAFAANRVVQIACRDDAIAGIAPTAANPVFAATGSRKHIPPRNRKSWLSVSPPRLARPDHTKA